MSPRVGSTFPEGGEMHTTEQRSARVAALRAAWQAGTLDLAIDPSDSGIERLLEAVLSDGPPRLRRSRR